VTINNLLPGMFGTDRLRTTIASQAKNMGVQRRGSHRAGAWPRFPPGAWEIRWNSVRRARIFAAPRRRMSRGQNFLIDGGAYPGTY
jgi:3-oxoacyl-[acyl-carrier protein] reductase